METVYRNHQVQLSLFDEPSAGESAPAGSAPTFPVGVTQLNIASEITRKSHPETSFLAAMNLIAWGNLTKHESRAFDLVREFPGRTAAELDAIAGVKKRQIGKRLAGLAKKQKVRRGKRRMCEENGSLAVTWYLRKCKWKCVRMTYPMPSPTPKRLATISDDRSPTGIGTGSITAG